MVSVTTMSSVSSVGAVPIVRGIVLVSGVACVLEVGVGLSLVDGGVTSFTGAVLRPMLVPAHVVLVLAMGVVEGVVWPGTGRMRC
jgi:hypothetical protein